MPRVSAAYLETRRGELLDAAARCFARDGFHRTTMHDIAREAEASAGLLYRYFASKEEVVAAIAAQRREAEKAALAAASGADVGDALHALVAAFAGRLADREEQAWRRVTVQLWAEALRNPEVMAVVEEGLREPLATIGALVKRGQREGRIGSGLDPTAVARVAAALFQGLVLQQSWEGDRVDVRAYLHAAETLLASLVDEPATGARRATRAGSTRARPKRGRVSSR
jgi:AcrR family transcriptional regulator